MINLVHDVRLIEFDMNQISASVVNIVCLPYRVAGLIRIVIMYTNDNNYVML